MLRNAFPAEAAYDVVFFDLDGTFHLGGVPFEGVVEELIACAARGGTRFVALTNNTSVVPAAHVAKLERMGLAPGSFELCSPLDVVADARGRTLPDRIFPVVTAQVAEFLTSAGFEIVTHDAHAVLVGFDLELGYEKLATACRLIEAGAALHATHIDVRCPTQTGYIPDCGAMTAMLEATTGARCVETYGKPSRSLADYLNRHFRRAGERALLVGDRLYTDIVLASEMEIDGILVLTGETTLRDAQDMEGPRPTAVFDNMSAMLAQMGCR